MEVARAITRRAREEHVRRRYPLSLPLCMPATQANPNMATLSFFRDSNLDTVISCKNQDYDLVHELALASLRFSYLQNLTFKSRGPNCGLALCRINHNTTRVILGFQLSQLLTLSEDTMLTTRSQLFKGWIAIFTGKLNRFWQYSRDTTTQALNNWDLYLRTNIMKGHFVTLILIKTVRQIALS